MATIDERLHKSGRVTYRVRLRKRGHRPFSITFDYREEAVQFVRDYEDNYRENPYTMHAKKKEWYYTKLSKLK